jgi:hypothetical protein
MKKIIMILALSLFAAGSAFAAGTNTGTLDLTKTGLSAYGQKGAGADILLGKTSTGVGLGWATSANGYSMVTQHKSGTRAFGTSYDTTSMFFVDKAVGTAAATPSASDSTAFGTGGWQSM